MGNIITCRDIDRFISIVCESTQETMSDLIFDVLENGQLIIKDSKMNIYSYNKMEEEIKAPSYEEIFDVITLKDFLWNVNEYQNCGYLIKVNKGSKVRREYYRNALLKAYDEEGNCIPKSDIDLVKAYKEGIIIHEE